MTPDQLLLLKRILQMSPAEFLELRENFRLYENAIDKLHCVVGRPNRIDAIECISRMEDHVAAIRAMP